jgi:hypothetical protein
VIWEAEGIRYKMTRVLIGSDGSYYVTCPYFPADKVSISTRTVKYINDEVDGPHLASPPIEVGLVDAESQRLKMTHHGDGFIQVSGEGITSGRNADGTPKGIGIFSWPLGAPTAGPAFGITVQNPRTFAVAESERTGDVVFRESDYWMVTQDTGLMIELFYFAPHWRRFVIFRDGRPVLPYKHPSGAVLELAVCRGPGEDWSMGFVGVDLFPGAISLVDGDEGAFVLSTSTGKPRYNEETKVLEADAIYAAYPPIPEDAKGRPVDLIFRPRDDPPYREGGKSPSSD